MFAMRRWLRGKAGKAFLAALLIVQVVPLVKACPMPMADGSMAYATAEMPDACAGLAKEACLYSYLQADRATGNDGAVIAAHPASVLRIAPPIFIALLARSGAPGGINVRSGAPPPRLLFCRLLQ
jgi:hypothetical protein